MGAWITSLASDVTESLDRACSHQADRADVRAVSWLSFFVRERRNSLEELSSPTSAATVSSTSRSVTRSGSPDEALDSRTQPARSNSRACALASPTRDAARGVTNAGWCRPAFGLGNGAQLLAGDPAHLPR